MSTRAMISTSVLVVLLLASTYGLAVWKGTHSVSNGLGLGRPSGTLRTATDPVASSSLVMNLTVNPEATEVGFVVNAHCNVTGGMPPWVASLGMGDGIYSNITYSNAPYLSFGIGHVYNSAGVYRILCTATDGSQSTGFANRTVVIFADPLVRLDGSAASILQGESLTLTATTGGGVGPFVYQWRDLPPGCAATAGPSLTCSPTTSGTWRVRVTVEDSYGSTDTDTFEVSVGPSLFGVPLSTFGVSAAIVAGGVLVVWWTRRRRRVSGAPQPPKDPPDGES